MTAVFGASLGVSGIHGVSLDLATTPPTSTESFARLPVDAQDQWAAVTSAVADMAHASSTPVLALRDKNPIEAYGVEYIDGLAVVSELGAQIGALQESGDLAGEETIALFDVGAGGVTVSIVERESGRVHSSRRSSVLSGDGCDAALTRALLDRHGRGPLAPDAQELFVELVCTAKEDLSRVTSVNIDGPFRSGTVRLHRSELDDLIRENVYDAVTLAVSMIAEVPRVDALFAVGGGANMQIVRQSLFDAVSVPVYVPVEPRMLAAKGAAGTARGLFEGTSPARAAGGPRHSDTSSKRLTRLKRSRYLGGAVALLVAGGVATSIAAAASREEAPASTVEFSPAITTTEASTTPRPGSPAAATTSPDAPSSATSSTASSTTLPTTLPSAIETTSARTTTAEESTSTKRSPDPTTTQPVPTTTVTRTRDPRPSTQESVTPTSGPSSTKPSPPFTIVLPTVTRR